MDKGNVFFFLFYFPITKNVVADKWVSLKAPFFITVYSFLILSLAILLLFSSYFLPLSIPQSSESAPYIHLYASPSLSSSWHPTGSLHPSWLFPPIVPEVCPPILSLGSHIYIYIYIYIYIKPLMFLQISFGS